MATMSNTVRWTRRGNSEIRNKSTSLIDSPSEAFKLPALNALNKSIKYNDLSFATSRDLHKLRKQPEQVDNIQEISAHHSLMVIRKKYDNMNKTREEIQREVEEMQKKRDKFLNEKNRFQEQKSKGSDKVHELQQNLNAIRLHLEQSQMQKKVMLSMVERLKSDKVVYDLRKYKLEKQLAFIQKQKQIILRENAGKMEEEDKTKKIYQKLMEHLEAEKTEREAHVNSMQTMLSEKVTLNENSELRKSQMMEIAENTLQDKDLKQKNWYKVYLCCKFVQRLLRDKMTREMLKFNTVQVAFKNIKTATGVTNTTDLVKKFLNKENAYGQLLGKIADNQRHISELKNENEELMRDRRKLQTEQDELNSNRKQTKDLNKEEKLMHHIGEKTANCELLMEKLSIWSSKNIKKFNSIDNHIEQLEVSNEPEGIINQFKVYLQRISSSVEEVQISDIKIDPKVDIGGNNCRILLNPKQQKVQKNVLKNINDQDDFVNNQRSEILKNNDKFMKELKKKYEDIKKAKLQAEPKKKEIVVEKPKPQPIQS